MMYDDSTDSERKQSIESTTAGCTYSGGSSIGAAERGESIGLGSAVLEPLSDEPREKKESSAEASPNTPYMAIYQRRALFLAILILLIGVGAGLAFMLTGIRSVQEDQDQAFEKEAEELIKSVESSWKEFSITSIWMHQACRGDVSSTPAVSIGCTREEFDIFYDYIVNSGLVFTAVMWVSNVSHAERPAVETESRDYYHANFPDVAYNGIVEAAIDETGNFAPFNRTEEPWYFVQHYTLPNEENNMLFLDYDFHSSPFLWPMVSSALEDVKPKVTQRLPKFNESSYFVQMYHPGIRRREDPRTNAVATVMVKIYDILERASQNKEEELSVFVYDYVPQVDPDEDPAFFMSGAQIHLNGNEGTSTSLIKEKPLNEVKESVSRYREAFIAIEDRTWIVLVTDSENTFEADLLVPILGGLSITLAVVLVAVWFYSSTRRAAYLQKVQADAEAEKALLLSQTNDNLEKEVEVRLNELRQTEFLASEKDREAREAEARSESMMQTMSMLSHELKTPLQGIMGITSMALAEHKNKKNSAASAPETDAKAGSDEKIIENLYTIHASSQLLLTLINNLLDVRRISIGKMEQFVLECVDVAPIVKQCFETVKPLASLCDVQLNEGKNLKENNTGWLAEGAKLPIQQVLINLVSNAIKYSSMTDESTNLDINLRRAKLEDAKDEALGALCSSLKPDSLLATDTCDGQKEVLIVDVRDRGKGIPEEEASKIFGAFMMLKKHANTNKGFAQPTGSGLGLQLVGNMIEQMNGCVWVNNCASPNASDALRAADVQKDDLDGCVFSFFLECPAPTEIQEYQQAHQDAPRSDPENNIVRIESASEEDLAVPSSLVKGLQSIPGETDKVKVLLVDDVLINVRVIRRILEAIGLEQIRTAVSGLQAIKMLREDPECHLILTDYQMPGMDGLEMSSAIRKLYAELDKPVPLITLCTADSSATVREKCQSVGIKDMLRKPVTLGDLSSLIENKKER